MNITRLFITDSQMRKISVSGCMDVGWNLNERRTAYCPEKMLTFTTLDTAKRRYHIITIFIFSVMWLLR